jgi:hypothetical protein
LTNDLQWGRLTRLEARDSMRTLKVISGPAAGTSLGVDKEIVIGREGADLTISDPQISRRHTLVRPVDEGIEVEDLGSLNGTFVNGERVSAPVTLTAPGKIKIGDSEIDVELALEEVPDGLTQLAPAPAGAAARGSVRRVEESAPAAEAAAPGAHAAATLPPRVEPTPRRPTPPPPAPPSGGRPPGERRPLGGLLLGALVVAGAVAVGLFLLLSDDDGAVQTYPLVASLRTADLVQQKKLITFAGTVNQTPGGLGTVIGRLNLKADVTTGKTVNLTGSMIFRFDDGRIDATVTGTARRRADKTTDLILTGKINRGTREYEGAKGSFSLKSRQEVATVPTVGIGSFEGTIKY